MREAAGDGEVDITRRHGVCGGKATVGATRVRVNNVVFMHKQGQCVEEIREAYPDLSEAQVEAALAYYQGHTAEIEAELARDAAFETHFERLKAEYLARLATSRGGARAGGRSSS
jgi:uncharacterized protein (DUF433 family)